MQLITSAHLGEALGVIEFYGLERVSPTVFQGDELICLITGEGPFEAATATSHLLGKHNFQRVINLGIAGSLANIPVGTLCPIRSVYLAIDGKPQFKSFKSSDEGMDCITSFERILIPEKAKILSGLGQLVDREAWGVAMAAKQQQIAFESYKIISDEAGTLGACELVKEQASEYSLKLAQHLKTFLHKEHEQKAEIELPGFHFTFSMQSRFEQYLKNLSLRNELDLKQTLQTLPIDELRSEKLLPKDRAQKLLKILEERLDPLKHKLALGLQQWKTPYERSGIQLQTDPTWESATVQVKFDINSQEELQTKMKQLGSLDLKPFHQLRNGHVE